MKLIKLLLEQWKPHTGKVMGKTLTSIYTGETDNLEELLKRIDNLPDTIESIKVPLNLKQFTTSADNKVIRPTGNWKQEVKDVLKNTLSQEGGQDIDTFAIHSFFPIAPNEAENFTAPLYISLKSQKHREFGRQMGSGKYGSLD